MLAEISDSAHCSSQSAPIPTASVARMLRVANATAAAASAARTFGSVHAEAPVAGPVTTIGRMSAVSIAAGTNLSARASSGGIARRANSAMNDRRDR